MPPELAPVTYWVVIRVTYGALLQLRFCGGGLGVLSAAGGDRGVGWSSAVFASCSDGGLLAGSPCRISQPVAVRAPTPRTPVSGDRDGGNGLGGAGVLMPQQSPRRAQGRLIATSKNLKASTGS